MTTGDDGTGLQEDRQRLELLRREAAPHAGGRDLLLYHRRAQWLRVRRYKLGGRVETSAGHEQGTSLLSWAGPGSPAGFAATTGLDADRVHWMLERAIEGGPPLEARPWAEPGQPRLDDDVDPGERLPPAAEVGSWLDGAWGRLSAADGEGGGRGVHGATVDVARTVETWAAEGWSATRVRCRAWARATTDRSGEGAAPAPLTVAARRWTGLDPDGWARILADRVPGQGAARQPAPEGPLLFGPESAATLVMALVRALHTGGWPAGRPVGRGWRLLDDPDDPAALYGASFDDCGFPTRREPLADGGVTARALRGLRRPSYRDRPRRLPFQIVVDPPACDAPAEGWLVSGVRIHPVGPRWILDLDGAELRGGRPHRRVRGSLPIVPEDWVAACAGGVGPARASHLGAVTPALCFVPPAAPGRAPGR